VVYVDPQGKEWEQKLGVGGENRVTYKLHLKSYICTPPPLLYTF
jgi:hypothetical protein